VFYLKMKGLEQRRQKATRNINMQDKTLKEIIESSSDEEEKYNKFNIMQYNIFFYDWM